MNKKLLKENLLKLEIEDLVNLLLLSLDTHKNWKTILLKKIGEILEKRKGQATKSIYVDQFSGYLQQVCEIFEERNENGGGPDREYTDVSELLDEIGELFIQQRLTSEHKQIFFDQMFEHYDWGNSGMEDMILDSVYNAAETPEDWKYIIEKLQKEKDRYRQEHVMNIYKNQLHDEQMYLLLRQSQLEYGMDYYDLVKFYEEKGDQEKALEIAKIGREKGQGRIIDLVEFLFTYYKNRNYQEALVYAKDIFEDSPNLDQYHKLKSFIKEEDWEKIDMWCRTLLREHDLILLHMENKNYEKVLTYVLTKPNYYSPSFTASEKDDLAKQLISLYPKELLEYYIEKVEQLLKQMDRKNYHFAAE